MGAALDTDSVDDRNMGTTDRAEKNLKRRGAASDALIALILIAGLGYLDHRFTAGQQFSGMLAIVGSMLIVFAMVKMRGQTLADLGLRRPKRIWTLPFWFIAVMAVTLFSLAPLQAMLVPYFPPPDLDRFMALQGNLPLFLGALVSVWITAALFEELIYRGFFVNRLRTAFGGGLAGGLMAAALHAIPFGLLHAYQGSLGIILTGAVALVFGIFFILNGRNLWVLILAHGTIDTLGMVQFYLAGPPNVS